MIADPHFTAGMPIGVIESQKANLWSEVNELRHRLFRIAYSSRDDFATAEEWAAWCVRVAKGEET